MIYQLDRRLAELCALCNEWYVQTQAIPPWVYMPVLWGPTISELSALARSVYTAEWEDLTKALDEVEKADSPDDADGGSEDDCDSEDSDSESEIMDDRFEEDEELIDELDGFLERAEVNQGYGDWRAALQYVPSPSVSPRKRQRE